MKIIDEMPTELLDAMNKFSVKLEWARRLPIYEIHKWWARRYSGIVRLVLAFCELEKKTLNKISDFDSFVQNTYFDPPKVKNKKLLDPFCGGGTIIIEGAKMGYETYGIEINKLPVLTLESLKILKEIDFKFIEEKIFYICEQLKTFWITKCKAKHDALIIHTFLVWKNKKGEKQIKINLLKDDKEKTYFCQKCKKIFKSKENLEKCQICGNNFNEKYEKIEYNKIEPYVIEYFCPVCNKREFKVIEDEDLEKFNITFRKKLFKIPKLNETNRLIKAGLKDFSQLLTPRQQLTFHTFLSTFKIEPYKTIAKLIVSDCVRSCSLLAWYSPKYKKVIPGFIIKSYWLPSQPVELNPLSFQICSENSYKPLGRGTIFSSLKKLKKAKQFVTEEQLPLDFKLYNGPAQDILPKLKGKMDIVFTDPPYGDYQFYSDLSLFNLSLIDNIDSNYLKEILEKEVVLRKRKDINKYKSQLNQIFYLINTKLSENGKILITYHHHDINILYAILEVFKELRINLHAIYPVIGESSGRLSRRKIYLDLLFVFGKQKKKPYYTLTNFYFTPYDKKLQDSIENLINFYE
ncbi:MAG: hypothetical protein H5T50_08650 [Nitrososphaeria archaeon]|nr:hypothetical protein [Nitrososphaeria archaeon]